MGYRRRYVLLQYRLLLRHTGSRRNAPRIRQDGHSISQRRSQALQPIAGSAAAYPFAVGIIGAGFLAVPVLTGSSAYAVAETFGWRYGLNTKPRQARQFYTVIAISTLIGTLTNFVGINPISALFWTAVINGLLSPPLLVIIMLISNNKKVMGNAVNGQFTNIVGWATTLIMFAAAIGMLATSR